MSTNARKAEIAQKRAMLIEKIYRDIIYEGNSNKIDDEHLIKELLSLYYKLINKDSRRFNKVIMR